MPADMPTEVDHSVTNYVDDSSNSVGAKSLEEIRKYTECYMEVVERYYEANRLKLNMEKTTIMIVGNQEKKESLKLKLGKHTVTNDLSIKILGWWISPDLKLNHHISKIKGPIYRTLAEIKPYVKFMSLKLRREIVYSKAVSIINYGLALYSGQCEEIKDRMTTIIMKANRLIYNQPILDKTKNEWLCKKIGVKTPRQLMAEAAAKAMHSVINTQQPPEIFKLLVFPKHFRKAAQVGLKSYPRTKKCRRSIFYRALMQFNDLPEELRYCHPKMFKRMVRKRRIREVPDPQ